MTVYPTCGHCSHWQYECLSSLAFKENRVRPLLLWKPSYDADYGGICVA